MAELSNWLGDLWEEAADDDERVYDWADDEVLETAFAKAAPATELPADLAGALTEALGSAPAQRKAPSAMAELSATARRPEPAANAIEPDAEPPVPVEPVAAEPLHPVLMGSGRTRVEDDILPTRRPQGGRLVALRMSLRTSR
jgi:hypothetical protein